MDFIERWINSFSESTEDQLLELAKGSVTLMFLPSAPLVAGWYIFDWPVPLAVFGVVLALIGAMNLMVIETHRTQRSLERLSRLWK